jgi:hypothetical protein
MQAFTVFCIASSTHAIGTLKTAYYCLHASIALLTRLLSLVISVYLSLIPVFFESKMACVDLMVETFARQKLLAEGLHYLNPARGLKPTNL